MMTPLGSIIANPATPWVVAGALVAWTGWSCARALRRTGRLNRQLKQARERICTAADPGAFFHDYESISSDLTQLSIIGPRWREFKETLLIPTQEGRPIQATAPAQRWFDLSMLSDAKIDQRYHAALPNLLVGAGLLFTFLGLTVALYNASGIVAENASQAERSHALQGLLDAAAFKFITSLAGLLLSISYAIFWRWRCRLVERYTDGFLTDLEYRVPFRTATVAQEEANDLAQRQLETLQTFSNDLAVSIGTSLDQAFDKRLGEHIGPLTQAMERLASGMATQNQDAIQRMLDEFLNRLQGGTGEKMQEIALQFTNLAEGLQELRAGLQNSASQITAAAESMVNRMGQGAEQAVSRLTHAASDNAARAADLAREVGSLIEATNALPTHLSQFRAALNEVTASLARSAADLRAAGEATRAGVQPLQEVSQTVAGAINQIEGAAESLQRTVAEIRDLTQAMIAASGRFEGVDRSLADVLNKLQIGLEAFQRETSTYVSQTDNNLAKAASQLHSVLLDITEIFDDFKTAFDQNRTRQTSYRG